MIVKQEMTVNSERKIILRNTVDCSAASELAAERSKGDQGRISKDMYCIGHIPPEMWNFNPWLIAAKRAKWEGDMGKYHKNLMKFFDLFSSFKILRSPTNFWFGGQR